MAEQSEFSKLPKKQLVHIAEKLIEKDFPMDNPYEDYQYDKNFELLESIGKYYDIPVNDEDVQFFAKFLYINSHTLDRIRTTNNKSYENLVIPVAKTYILDYDIEGSCTYIDQLSQKFDSYDKDWVEQSAQQQRQDGNWDLYNGYQRKDIIYDNFDFNDYTFEGVREYKPEKKPKITESILEKTSKVIKSLDKERLLELKHLIDSRINTL